MVAVIEKGCFRWIVLNFSMTCALLCLLPCSGEIPEVEQTYNVVGNVNEHGLIIGETTFGGLASLDGHGSSAIMDYGSLIWVTLQRAKTVC